jgi:hypothetical protein
MKFKVVRSKVIHYNQKDMRLVDVRIIVAVGINSSNPTVNIILDFPSGAIRARPEEKTGPTQQEQERKRSGSLTKEVISHCQKYFLAGES